MGDNCVIIVVSGFIFLLIILGCIFHINNIWNIKSLASDLEQKLVIGILKFLTIFKF